MAIRIIEIEPKNQSSQTDKILAHLSIRNFKWVNDQNLQVGVSSLDSMFDWIVNKKGKAYVKKDDNMIPIFGAIVPQTGQQYLRCIKDNKWSDELLELPLIS